MKVKLKRFQMGGRMFLGDLGHQVVLQWQVPEWKGQRMRKQRRQESLEPENLGQADGSCQASLWRRMALYIQFAMEKNETDPTMRWCHQEANHAMLHNRISQVRHRQSLQSWADNHSHSSGGKVRILGLKLSQGPSRRLLALPGMFLVSGEEACSEKALDRLGSWPRGHSCFLLAVYLCSAVSREFWWD